MGRAYIAVSEDGASEMSKEPFIVDAALLQELGERLIGQHHITLGELVKNAYDADATICHITFADDRIEIVDDGHGMSPETFKQFWLRIGTRHKANEQVSPRLKRPLTGAKGIGRLAVQFLASELELTTTAEDDPTKTTRAKVDWSKIVEGEELKQFTVDVTTLNSAASYEGHPHGTRLILRGLKNDWDADDIDRLGRELWMLRSPFRKLDETDRRRDDPKNFDVEVTAPEIEDAEETFNRLRDALTETLWRARIDGRIEQGRTNGSATIEIQFQSGYPEGAREQRYIDHVQIPIQKTRSSDTCFLDDVRFQIYIYRLEHRQAEGIPVGELRDYLGEYGNVSIYDGGFRLPYYGTNQDWLEIEEAHASRLSISSLLPSRLNIDGRYMLDLPTVRRIFGVVELSTSHEERVAKRAGAKAGSWLQIQPGRDRLHDNAAYEQLADLVRYSLDFYANRYKARSLKAVEAKRYSEPPARKQGRVVDLLQRHETEIPAVVYKEIRREAVDAQKAVSRQDEEMNARAALLAPLAAAGMTALAVTHELARETRTLESAERNLRALAKKHDLPEIAASADTLAASLKRLRALQTLFSPLLTDEDREGDSRLRVLPVVRQIVDAMSAITNGMTVEIDIPEDMRFPSAPLASWNALLQNVLANSWNAILEAKEARVKIEGNTSGRDQWLWVSDTGTGLNMPLAEADKLFEPFERNMKVGRDHASLVIGGQGLGLAIVRMLASRHKADVSFVEPEKGFSTTMQISWRG